MRNVATMAQHEIGVYFLSPIAYAVNAIFLFSAGLAFGLGTFTQGGEASLRTLFDFWIILILVFVLPMLTMRLMSEELRSGTIETLITAPITEAEVILGKFLGALVFFVVQLALLLVYPLMLEVYGNVDLGLLVCHYVGLLLLGSLYIAVGLFFSTVTKHQVIAVLASFSLLALMTFASHALADETSGLIKVLLQQMSIRTHFQDFVRGTLDLNHMVFFLSMIAFFLFISVKMLETRRWQ